MQPMVTFQNKSAMGPLNEIDLNIETTHRSADTPISYTGVFFSSPNTLLPVCDRLYHVSSDKVKGNNSQWYLQKTLFLDSHELQKHH